MNNANVFVRCTTVFKIVTEPDGQDVLMEQPLSSKEEVVTRGQVFLAMSGAIDEGFQFGAVSNGSNDAKHRITLVRYPDIETIEKEMFSAELDAMSLEIEYAYFSLIARAHMVATPLKAWFFVLQKQIEAKLGISGVNLGDKIAGEVMRKVPTKPSVAIMSAMIAARLVKGGKHFDGKEFAEWIECFTKLNRNAVWPYLIECEYTGADVNNLPANLFPI